MEKIGGHMKNLFLIIICLLAMNASAQDKPLIDHQVKSSGKSISTEFSGKLGAAYTSQPEKFGLDLSANYIYVLDRYFTVGLELDMLWLNWDRTLGEKEIGQTVATVKAQTDAFLFPFLFNAQVKFPGLFSAINLVPSFTIGLGWSGLIISDSIPEYTKQDSSIVSAQNELNFYGGFAWQCYSSLAFKPQNSEIAFIIDIGYRSTQPSQEGIEFDMSGLIAKTGVKFFLN